MHDYVELKIKFAHDIQKLLYKTHPIITIYIFILIFKFRIIITKYNGKQVNYK